MKITSFADKLQVKATFAGSKIVELGVYCKPSPAEDRVVESMETLRFVDHPYLSDTWKTPFVYLGEISISRGISPKYAIHSISKNITSYGETQLSWKVTPQIDDPPEHLQGPYSGTTGPFSNFIIYCAGEMQGLAFATKFTLKTPIGRVDDQEFSIDGVMWDGTIISSSS